MLPSRGDGPERRLLGDLFSAAVAAVSAEQCLPGHLPDCASPERLRLLAVGKAAAGMAAVAATRYGPSLRGLVVTRTGHGVAAHRLPAGIDVIESGHPVPDAASLEAGRRALALATSLRAQDHLIVLLSGGGSALLAAPVEGVALADKQATTRSLLHSGATIAEINCVRKHLSRIKGGRLAVAARPAAVHTRVISDVPGDDPALVASGPTLEDDTTLADARAILERYRLAVPDSVAKALSEGGNETPRFLAGEAAGDTVAVVARARDALQAATKLALDNGYVVDDLGDCLQGEARGLGAAHALLARRAASLGQRRILLSGGETTVTVRNAAGRGGRNLEYLLSLALALDGAPRIFALACDTDGIDGTDDSAGAIVTPDTLRRARTKGLDAARALDRNDAYGFFAALGDLVVTGPTGTNVNDFRAILVADPGPP